MFSSDFVVSLTGRELPSEKMCDAERNTLVGGLALFLLCLSLSVSETSFSDDFSLKKMSSDLPQDVPRGLATTLIVQYWFCTGDFEIRSLFRPLCFVDSNRVSGVSSLFGLAIYIITVS